MNDKDSRGQYLRIMEKFANVDNRVLSAQHWPTLANVVPILANVGDWGGVNAR